MHEHEFCCCRPLFTLRRYIYFQYNASAYRNATDLSDGIELMKDNSEGIEAIKASKTIFHADSTPNSLIILLNINESPILVNKFAILLIKKGLLLQISNYNLPI